MTNCSDVPPQTPVYYEAIRSDVFLLVSMCIACVLTIITAGIFIQGVVFTYKYVHDHTTRSLKYTALLALYPVASILSLIVVFVPTSSVLVDLILSCYISVCIYLFITVVFDAFGGTDRMVETLSKEKIMLSTPPLCCLCFCCLRPITLTKKSLLVFESFGMQVMIVRPILMLIASVLWTNGSYEQKFGMDEPYAYIVVVSACSTVLSIYGIVVIFRASKDHLKHYKLVLKFLSLQAMVIALNFQNSIFNMLGSNGIPACLGPIGSKVRAKNLNNLILVLEAFLLGLLARKAYMIHPEDLQAFAKTSVASIHIINGGKTKSQNGYLQHTSVNVPNMVDTVTSPEILNSGEVTLSQLKANIDNASDATSAYGSIDNQAYSMDT